MRVIKCLLPVVIFSAMVLFSSCGGKKEKPVVVDSLAISYRVINTLPHNVESFIEGLVIHDNKIYESTGGKQSWIAEVNPASGQHDKKVILDDMYFGEGIAILNNKIYQLTWKTKIGFIYNARTYDKIGEFTYTNQGWGLTHDNVNLIMSDGTSKLTFIDTTTMKPIRTVTVKQSGTPVEQLNELEYIDGFIFANVWQSDIVVKIDPATGNVVGRLDLSALAQQARSLHREAEVTNGIAYDKNSKALLVTGKMWPKAYLIKLN